MPGGSPEPVEPGHYQRVPRLEGGKALVQFRPGGQRARRAMVREHDLASGRLEAVDLGIQALVRGRNPAIADQAVAHTAIVSAGRHST